MTLVFLTRLWHLPQTKTSSKEPKKVGNASPVTLLHPLHPHLALPVELYRPIIDFVNDPLDLYALLRVSRAFQRETQVRFESTIILDEQDIDHRLQILRSLIFSRNRASRIRTLVIGVGPPHRSHVHRTETTEDIGASIELPATKVDNYHLAVLRALACLPNLTYLSYDNSAVKEPGRFDNPFFRLIHQRKVQLDALHVLSVGRRDAVVLKSFASLTELDIEPRELLYLDHTFFPRLQALRNRRHSGFSSRIPSVRSLHVSFQDADGYHPSHYPGLRYYRVDHSDWIGAQYLLQDLKFFPHLQKCHLTGHSMLHDHAVGGYISPSIVADVFNACRDLEEIVIEVEDQLHKFWKRDGDGGSVNLDGVFVHPRPDEWADARWRSP